LILTLLCFPKPRSLSQAEILEKVHQLGVDDADETFIKAIHDLQELPNEDPQKITPKDGRFICKCST
jgi:hypothetical protein